MRAVLVVGKARRGVEVDLPKRSHEAGPLKTVGRFGCTKATAEPDLAASQLSFQTISVG